MSDAKRVRIQFGSQDYFDLLAKYPQTAPWLALSQSVQFLWEGTIYEVYQ
jgi:hypothetical protein